MPEFTYKLKSTGGSSHQYGNCDICSKHATEMFIQTESKHFKFEHNGKVYEGWAQQNINFGHEQCLVNVRKNRLKAVS